MPFLQRKTFNQLKAEGWTFENDGVCGKCGDDVEWHKSKNGNPLPYNPGQGGQSIAIPHKETCSG